MTRSLGLDSEEVETTWIYFHFHQTSPGGIVTAYCEPRKKERNANYNWKIYHDEMYVVCVLPFHPSGSHLQYNGGEGLVMMLGGTTRP